MGNNSFFLVLLTFFLLITQPYLLLAADCKVKGHVKGVSSDKCNPENDSECCVANKLYPTYDCSPPVTGSTRARMTLNSFEEGGDGGAPSECDEKFHADSELVVALSTGWYSKGSRCGKKIRINGNGKSVLAKVVDECDSMHGCDDEHDFQPPCDNNVVDASPEVWKKLGYTGDDVGDAQITWSDAGNSIDIA